MSYCWLDLGRMDLAGLLLACTVNLSLQSVFAAGPAAATSSCGGQCASDQEGGGFFTSGETHNQPDKVSGQLE